MKKLLMFVGTLLWVALYIAVAHAQVVAILPNGMSQFTDGNGAPYAGGRVYFYIPNTTTPKTTYQDPLAHSPNQNPVVLDANGRAVIWGNGEYRQVVQDANGVVVWDQLTYASPASPNAATGSIWFGTSTGTANAITLATPLTFTGQDGQSVGFIANATNTGSATINASGFGSVLVEKNTAGGLAVLTGGEVVIGGLYYATYDAGANAFVLQNPTAKAAQTSGKYSQVVTDSVGNTYYSPVYDITAFGGVGDSTTNNNTAFASAFAALGGANGGRLHLPCGTFLLTGAPNTTIAAGKHVEMVGDGQDCTILLLSGAIDGPIFTFTDQWSSATVKDLSIVTTQAGGTTCLTYTGAFANPPSAYASASLVENVTFRGTDAYSGGGTRYCGTGFNDVNISNVNVVGLTFQGITSRAGTAIAVAGSGIIGTYAVQFNVVDSFINNCGVGLQYGDWAQGVTMTNVNAVGCNFGVNTVSSPAGTLDQLSLVNSQFNTYSCGVCINAPLFNNVMLSNSMFITNVNSRAIRLQGTNFTVTGNQIAGTTTAGTVGIDVLSTYGNGGVVTGNSLLNFGTGIKIAAASTALFIVSNNQFSANTVDYNINAGAAGVEVKDVQRRNLAVINAQLPCNSAIVGSTALQADGGGGAYLANATSGGAEVVPLACNGSNWKNH